MNRRGTELSATADLPARAAVHQQTSEIEDPFLQRTARIWVAASTVAKLPERWDDVRVACWTGHMGRPQDHLQARVSLMYLTR